MLMFSVGKWPRDMQVNKHLFFLVFFIIYLF